MLQFNCGSSCSDQEGLLVLKKIRKFWDCSNFIFVIAESSLASNKMLPTKKITTKASLVESLLRLT